MFTQMKKELMNDINTDFNANKGLLLMFQRPS